MCALFCVLMLRQQKWSEPSSCDYCRFKCIMHEGDGELEGGRQGDKQRKEWSANTRKSTFVRWKVTKCLRLMRVKKPQLDPVWWSVYLYVGTVLCKFSLFLSWFLPVSVCVCHCCCISEQVCLSQMDFTTVIIAIIISKILWPPFFSCLKELFSSQWKERKQ